MSKPRILIMGEEVSYDDLPAAKAIDMEDYFKPVKISPRAIDQASRIVPVEHFKSEGLYTWISKRANHVFKKLNTDLTKGQLGPVTYHFEYDENGPFLSRVSI